MNDDDASDFGQVDEDVLTDAVSDEELEAAAGDPWGRTSCIFSCSFCNVCC